MSTGSRPIRFLTVASVASPDPSALIDTARRAESCGYSTVSLSDHLMLPFAPLIALQAMADATSTLRFTQTVLSQDFRHPAILAKELATLDRLSGGRLEVGIGAGWMRSEYEQLGLRYDPASVRIERLEEVVTILKGLFDDGPLTHAGRDFSITGLEGMPKPFQRPRPPIMVGGGGRKLLTVAGRQADIVQVNARHLANGPADPAEFCSPDLFLQKIDWIRAAAGDRFEDIELGVQMLLLAVTDDPEQAVTEFLAKFMPQLKRLGSSIDIDPDALISSPLTALGSVEEVCDRLLEIREKFGFSYFSVPASSEPEALQPVIQKLTGV